ncbi:MAG: glycoside hydrolase family protein [Candidatus Accumulibacter sp.]|jgi:lysozyme|nr:glycoside hydrolase family protein [Accumulibacter sp.]
MLDNTSVEKLLAQLKRQEGCKKNKDGEHVCYHCPAGKLTIGYGHNLEAWPVEGIGENSLLSEEEVSALLRSDVEKVITQVHDRLPWTENLDPARQAVLINMAFNMGIGTLLTFKNALKAAEEARYADAADNMLKSRWAIQVHGRAVELAAQMRTGQWSDEYGNSARI